MKLMLVRKSEYKDGFVAIVVAALIMVILSLITIGFTRMMQREQRQALDRQLTRQALYAAESGINDVYEYLRTADPMTVDVEKTECDVNALGLKNNGVISDSGNVSYTCILYDKTPGELLYSVGTSDSKISQLMTETRYPFSSVTIKWAQEEGLNNVGALPACGAAANSFPASRGGNVPMLRIDLTNIADANMTRDGLINGTDYLYVAPCNGASANTHTYGSATDGKTVQVGCNASDPVPCTLTINFGATNSHKYVARIRTVYDSALMTITGEERVPAGGTQAVSFDQSQTSIDVTARASDVVRRLRVSIPIAQPDNPPEGVFQSFDGVCKLLDVDAASAAPKINDGCPL